MAEIIFSDFYRTFLLCALSIVIAFGARNASIKEKIIAFAGYEFFVFFVCSWIFVVGIVFLESFYEALIFIIQLSGKWILYFTISMLLQLMIYHLLWKKNTALKTAALLSNIVIIAIIGSLFIYTLQ